MGYSLLWIENLASCLLLVAVLTALIGRLRSGRMRCALGVLAILVPLVFYSMLTGTDGLLEFGKRVRTGWFWPLLLLTLTFLVGAIEIVRRGLGRTATIDGTSAVTWSRGKLVVALVAALVLHAMTFSNLDAAVKQSLATVRAEATALALSVAPQRLPDQDNAALIYYQAFDAIGSESQGPVHEWPQVWRDAVEALDPETESKKESKFEFNSPELAEFLAHRAGLLMLLRAAAAKPGCYFDRDFGRPTVDMLLPELQDMRNASRLLAIHARWAAGQGNLAAALTDANAIYGIARHMGMEPLLVSTLASATIDQLASETLAAVLGTKPATRDELTGVDVDGAVSYRQMLSRTMRMEEAFILNVFAGLYYMDFRELSQMLETPENRSPLEGLGPLYRVFLLADDMAAYRGLMHEVERSLAMESYSRTKSRLAELDNGVRDQPPGLITSLLIPSLTACNELAVKSDAKRRVALVGLAMHRFRAEKGEFAEELDDLSPDFIPLLPRDPYDGKPLKLKKSPSGWTVYSIGPNMKDDRGRRTDDWENSVLQGDLTFEYVEPRQEGEQK